jgi:hypothetical protein
MANLQSVYLFYFYILIHSIGLRRCRIDSTSSSLLLVNKNSFQVKTHYTDLNMISQEGSNLIILAWFLETAVRPNSLHNHTHKLPFI